MFAETTKRAHEILRHIIDAYLETGEPVGSRTLSVSSGLNLSAATIRNVMADLEQEGLLFAPHRSAGRLPTQQGLRLYVDGLMQVGELSEEDRQSIEAQCRRDGASVNHMMERASSYLSGLSAAAGLVVAPKSNKPLRQIQFARLDDKRLMSILILDDGTIENRVLPQSEILPDSALTAAANYLNERLTGRTIEEARALIQEEIENNRLALDHLTKALVEQGLAVRAEALQEGHLIVKGQARLLENVKAMEDLDRARDLLSALEEQETVASLLQAANEAEGVQIFIGTESRVFKHAGWSLILSPYKNDENRIIGGIGVIGPERMNYGRVIPVVDYTAQIISRLMRG